MLRYILRWFVNDVCDEWNGVCEKVLINVADAINVGLGFGIAQVMIFIVSGLVLLYGYSEGYLKLSMATILLLLLTLVWTGVVVGGGTFSAYEWGFNIYLPCHIPIVLIIILKVLFMKCEDLENGTILYEV